MYRNWQVSGSSVSGEGGSGKIYRHYCPLEDFKVLARAAVKAAESRGFYTSADMETAAVEKNKMPSGLPFTRERHGYKVALATEYLVSSKMATRMQGRLGRLIRYKPAKSVKEWNAWLSTL